MSTKELQSAPLAATRPKDKRAGAMLDRLMTNCGLSPELLGVQVGVSGKRIRQVIERGDIPHRRVKHALARRFDLLPADIWKADAAGLSPAEIEHIRMLARRTEQVAAA